MDGGDNPLMEAKLRAAKSAMEAGALGYALTTLDEAAKHCHCYPRHGKDVLHPLEFSFPACNGGMTFFTRLVLSDKPEELLKNARVPCSCCRLFRRCSRQLHIEVVDRAVQCLEMSRNYIHAVHAAMYLIRMDPTLPVGYCRIFKILRHLDTVSFDAASFASQSISRLHCAMGFVRPSEKRTDFLQVMLAFVKHGLYNLPESVPGYQKNYRTVLKQIAHKVGLLRVDPLKKLPAEVLCMIFLQLDTPDLVKCQRVNRSWFDMVSGTQLLWHEVLFNVPGSPSRRSLVTFFKAHNEIRELVIRDTIKFGPDSSKLDLFLRFLPDLESIVLMSSSSRLPKPSHMPLGRPLASNWHGKIKKLCFVRIEQLTLDVLHPLLTHLAATLEDLTVVGAPAEVHAAFQGKQLASLKRLRLDSLQEDDPEHMRSRRRELYLMSIYTAARNLQQLYLDRYDLLWNNNALGPAPAAELVTWESLRVLVLGEGTRSFVGDEPRCLPRLGREMRVIDMTTMDSSLYHNVFEPRNADDDKDEKESYPHWPKLHTFRCRQRLRETSVLRGAVQPAIASGHLRVLDFGLGLRVSPAEAREARSRYNGWTTLPARDLGFTFSEHVHTLGLSDFAWSHTADCYSAFNPQPFLDWLAHFPAVRTVRVFPGSHANTGLLVTALIRRRVPTIVIAQKYAVRGASHYDASYADVAELAKEHGVELQMVKKDYTLPSWPFFEL